MMKTKPFLIFAICALLQSCYIADAQIVWLSTKNADFTECDQEEREVEPFDAVTNTCPFDVIYEQTDKQYVIVEGDGDYFDNLHTDVYKGVLEIKIDPARYRNVRLRVRVGSPRITQITMSGSGWILCESDIETDDDLAIRVSGSGDITTNNVKCGNLETSLSGSGDIRMVCVDAGNVDLNMAGSGDWRATQLKAEDMSITLAGSGDINIASIDIENSLSASVAGSGDIRINGQANNVKAKVVGSGDISGRLKYEHITKIKSGSGDIDW